MNLKKAKAMRRIAFGKETPYHSERLYMAHVYKWNENVPEIVTVFLKPGTPHAEYRRMKGVWNHGS